MKSMVNFNNTNSEQPEGRAFKVASDAGDLDFLQNMTETIIQRYYTGKKKEMNSTLTRAWNNYANEMEPIADRYAKMTYNITTEHKPEELALADKIQMEIRKALFLRKEQSKEYFNKAAEIGRASCRERVYVLV